MTIKIPPVLRPSVGGERTIQATGATVADVLDDLYAKHPSVKTQLDAGDGTLHRFVNLYLNDEDLRTMEWLETAVADSDTLTILPAMAGGSR
jgi:molybdopterin converting factor small subunit